MMDWERLLNTRWPQNRCDQSGECCRGAAQITPWKGLLGQASNGDDTARNFLNQYQPYPDQSQVALEAPEALQASHEIARLREQDVNDLIFYKCVYLKDKNQCQIYEDRPTLCRTFPESPFGAIPKCCGYYEAKTQCLGQIDALREELASLKRQQSIQE